jgi:hypothetical protein
MATSPLEIVPIPHHPAPTSLETGRGSSRGAGLPSGRRGRACTAIPPSLTASARQLPGSSLTFPPPSSLCERAASGPHHMRNLPDRLAGRRLEPVAAPRTPPQAAATASSNAPRKSVSCRLAGNRCARHRFLANHRRRQSVALHRAGPWPVRHPLRSGRVQSQPVTGPLFTRRRDTGLLWCQTLAAACEIRTARLRSAYHGGSASLCPYQMPSKPEGDD